MTLSKAIEVTASGHRARVWSAFVPKVRNAASRIRRLWVQRGPWATLQFLLTRVFRHEVHLVYGLDAGDMHPQIPLKPTERLSIVNADNLDAEINPALEQLLGGPMAFENLRGVRDGDLLFVITDQGRYVHRGYALFKTRQKKLLGEDDNTPLIAYCYTPTSERGHRVYERALASEIDYLQRAGFRRIAIETDPSNIPSQRGILAAGFALSREVRVWIVLNTLVIRLTRNGGQRLRVFIL
jgi:hypothetical protein